MDGERQRVEGEVVRLGRVVGKEKTIVKRLDEIHKVAVLDNNKDINISF